MCVLIFYIIFVQSKILNYINMKNKIEYRVIDLDMFDGEMSEVLNSMGEKGWEVVKFFESMKYTNSDGMFVRVIFKRFKPQTESVRYTRKDVTDIVYKTLIATGNEIRAEMVDINTNPRIIFDMDDLVEWLSKNI